MPPKDVCIKAALSAGLSFTLLDFNKILKMVVHIQNVIMLNEMIMHLTSLLRETVKLGAGTPSNAKKALKHYKKKDSRLSSFFEEKK